jgi:hypothetical protein
VNQPRDQTCVIDVAGSHARAESDLVMFDRVNDESQWTVRFGRYYDRLVREVDGQWRFAERRLEWEQ